jgi:uncharacterized RDD family membrane protein YckC
MAAPAAPATDVSTITRPYAGIASRAVGLAIDAGALTAGFAIASGVFGLILSLFTAVEVTSPAPVLGAAVFWSLVVAGYFIGFWTLAGETPGMRVMGLRVETEPGELPRAGQAVRRLIGMFLAAIPFFAGYLLVLVDDRRRGLHDMLGGTVVVYAPRKAASTAS